MNKKDTEHIVIKDANLRNNAELHRFNNSAGIPYSAIYLNGIEVGSSERFDEGNLVRWWNCEGRQWVS